MKKITRGDIFYADLGNGQGSEQSGYRPVLIIQNDLGNKYSPTVIIAPITKSNTKKSLPIHVKFSYLNNSNIIPCILLEQIRVIDKKRIKKYLGKLDKDTMKKVNMTLIKSLGLPKIKWKFWFILNII